VTELWSFLVAKRCVGEDDTSAGQGKLRVDPASEIVGFLIVGPSRRVDGKALRTVGESGGEAVDRLVQVEGENGKVAIFAHNFALETHKGFVTLAVDGGQINAQNSEETVRHVLDSGGLPFRHPRDPHSDWKVPDFGSPGCGQESLGYSGDFRNERR